MVKRYAYEVGLFVMLFFSWVLGYLVTQAEPALHVMGDQVQEIGLMRYIPLSLFSCFPLLLSLPSVLVFPLLFLLLPR